MIFGIGYSEKHECSQPKFTFLEDNRRRMREIVSDSFTEPVTNRYVQKWSDSVREAKTSSELHVLIEMLDMSIMWSKSIDNVVRIVIVSV